MHLFLWAEDSAAELQAEVAHALPDSALERFASRFLRAEFPVVAGQALPHLAFARQWLPHARPLAAPSISTLAAGLCDAVAGVLPDDQPWMLHIEPHYHVRETHRIGARAWHSATRHGDVERPQAPRTEAGRQRCEWVRAAFFELLQRRRRHLLRRLRDPAAPFTPADSLVQLVLTAPDAAMLSVAPAPLPFEQRHLLSPFPAGAIPVASDKAAPSRAFAKLLEAEQRLGTRISPGETCVDLGAAPGSWTYVAAGRGARVTAVDRSSLREDLLRHPRVDFQSGDAFRFRPGRPVDWLLCDVIAAPERTAALLLDWLRAGWCRRFVVTLKLGDAPAAGLLDLLKHELPALTREWFLTRLSANKKELCVFGAAAARRAG